MESTGRERDRVTERISKAYVPHYTFTKPVNSLSFSGRIDRHRQRKEEMFHSRIGKERKKDEEQQEQEQEENNI